MTSHVGEEPAIIMIVLTIYSRWEVGEVGTARGLLGGALMPGWDPWYVSSGLWPQGEDWGSLLGGSRWEAVQRVLDLESKDLGLNLDLLLYQQHLVTWLTWASSEKWV